MLNLAYQLYACFLDWHSQILPVTKAQPNRPGFEVDDRLQEFLQGQLSTRILSIASM